MTERRCTNCGHSSTLPPPEPPVGTWVRDRFGGLSYHQTPGGWGEPGIMPLGRWAAIWEARGPLVECGPWGEELPPTEGAALLAVAAAFDNRKPDADAAKVWAMALGGLPFNDCRDAIVAHYRKSSDWLMPAHLIATVKTIRNSRLEDAPPLTPPPGPDDETDPERVTRQLAWLREARLRIANGEAVDCDAAYGELKPRHLPDLRELMPRPEPTSEARAHLATTQPTEIEEAS